MAYLERGRGKNIQFSYHFSVLIFPDKWKFFTYFISILYLSDLSLSLMSFSSVVIVNVTFFD